MLEPGVTPRTSPRAGWIGASVMVLAFAAVLARTLALETVRPLLPLYLGLEMAYFLLLASVLWKPDLPGWLLHIYLFIQSALVLKILLLRPQFDSVVILFLPLSHQASLSFTGRTRWIWVMAFLALTGGSLIFYLGFLRGLSLALAIMAFEVVIPAYLIANQDLESTRVESERLLGDVRVTRRQLQSYAAQVEQLAAMQERNRVARELHDSVSQIVFSIALTTRSAQLLLQKDPTRVPEQLTRLSEMTADALSQLRSLITQLRPPQKT